MSESLSREIIIPDFDSLVLRLLIRFIHTDIINLSALEDHHAESLFVAANKYQIKGLLIICEEYMKATMNVNNASRRLLLFDTLEQKDLKAVALDFFKRNAFQCASIENFADNFGLSLCKELVKVMAGVKL